MEYIGTDTLSAKAMTLVARKTPVLAALIGTLIACTSDERAATVDAAYRSQVADSLTKLVQSAYDLSRGDVVAHFMSLYPDSGHVVSATAGRITTTRDSLQTSINAFWDGVGQYMVRPEWKWDDIKVDVLSRDVAVMTASYVVPHWTDAGRPHVIGGVWTSVWQRAGSGWRITHEHLSDMPRAVAERMEAAMPGADSSGHAGH